MENWLVLLRKSAAGRHFDSLSLMNRPKASQDLAKPEKMKTVICHPIEKCHKLGETDCAFCHFPLKIFFLK
ncbi:hypothetical protein [Sporolactobacillus pectinivorans]|uniref:hypothetical protein n=1 Tax=Sporolactobacillus pectinivorans TaxID=1591408 RepID=UPI0012FD2821|nr:hypothetical protein [Sporolactobacillus pectinivorans]